MKKLLLALIFIPAIALSQKKIDVYSASNGITYKEGDIIKLGRGSATNGDFLYLQMGGWAALAAYDTNKGSDQNNIGRSYSGMNVTLKKMMQQTRKGATKTIFVVGGGNITNYNLLIEDAIATCEIADCKGKEEAGLGKLEQIKKLKELLDSGALTQKEFDEQKQKLLSQ